MIKNFVEELKWRGMLAQIMPGTEEFLNKGMVVFPTQSLVCNTGFESGEHPDSQVDKARLTSSRDVSLNKDIHFPTDVYKENIKARIALKKYYRKRTTLKGNILLYLEKYVKRR